MATTHSNKWLVADALLDSAVAEFRNLNFVSADTVGDYADMIDIPLTPSECEEVLAVCRKIDELESTDDCNALAYERLMRTLEDPAECVAGFEPESFDVVVASLEVQS